MALKTGVVVLTIAVAFALAMGRNFIFYPKVWKARITVDGLFCPHCAVYVHRTHLGGVLVRNDGHLRELYSVAFPNPQSDVPHGAVWKCRDGAFLFGPGFAFEHFVDVGPFPCGGADSHLSGEKRIELRLIEFTDHGGQRVKAQW